MISVPVGVVATIEPLPQYTPLGPAEAFGPLLDAMRTWRWRTQGLFSRISCRRQIDAEKDIAHPFRSDFTAAGRHFSRRKVV